MNRRSKGMIVIMLLAVLLITNHYIQIEYYTGQTKSFKVFGFPIEAHFLVDLVIYVIIFLFIVMIRLFDKTSKR